MKQLYALTLTFSLLLSYPLAFADTDWSQYADLQDEQSPESLIAAPTRDTNQASPYEGPPGYNPDKGPDPKPKPKRKWWEFWKLFMTQADPEPTPTEEQLIDVGPREFDASPEPLLRWPRVWKTSNGSLPPGMYLIRSNIKKAEPSYKPPQLEILRGSQILWTIPLQPLTGGSKPQSPVTMIEPKKGEKAPSPHRSIRLFWSQDGRAVRFHYQVGPDYYQSPWMTQTIKYQPLR